MNRPQELPANDTTSSDREPDLVLHQTLVNLEMHHNQVFWGQLATLAAVHGFLFSGLSEFPSYRISFLAAVCVVAAAVIWRMMAKNAEDRMQNRKLRNAIERRVLSAYMKESLRSEQKADDYLSFSANPLRERISLKEVRRISDIPYAMPWRDNKSLIAHLCFGLIITDLLFIFGGFLFAVVQACRG